ncbi:tRNA (adenosine(37)-N6)-threonylcarbamoyltransferase complex ATPase subunit type 1 TsaE [Arundinibacter roseus]|uniref:tRNA threonylcarbamoyladenosine biosynthesis protein TsaE n=1 Tax=Arundinibacter roseus TaxID=2070510 RepID=A0A4R4KF64_9BACT|nr:tRNA (adenosine(37)-N6)-threonylcarbamoyltransferase complex ATPase subunit type 1 TsaE [Arundinibacter roseus]TDB65099.1 tRNA (adenosine(37)-N6)-threonylcarbamoyltransferase complex ATPase subunit type 1 TsaE [Arundinibacter roseus]
MKARSIFIQFRELSELEEVAAQLLSFAGNIPVWLFSGEMGIGKTTLIKAICQKLQVQDAVHSPTFSLVNEYKSSLNKTIFHFDFYRIKDEVEAYDMGAEEYLDSGNYCFIEWPDKIESLWPDTYVMIELLPGPDFERIVRASLIS